MSSVRYESTKQEGILFLKEGAKLWIPDGFPSRSSLESDKGAWYPNDACPRVSASPVAYDRGPPVLGEHTAEVLKQWLGVSA